VKKGGFARLLSSLILAGALIPGAGAIEVNWLSDGLRVAADLYTGAAPLEADDPVVVAGEDSAGSVRYGLVRQSGELILSPSYRDAKPFSEGLALVRRNGDGAKYGFIDRDGKTAIPMRYSAAGSFSEGYAWFRKEDAEGGTQAGFVDQTGRERTLLPYAETGSFSEGLAWVMQRGAAGEDPKYGFVVHTGMAVVSPRYDGAEDFSGGLARVMQLDENGAAKYGFVDRAGKLAVPLDYDGAESFSEGLALVRRDGEGWGFIDRYGEVAVPLVYDGAASFSGGLAPVVKRDADGSKKYGAVNRTGELVVPLAYDYISEFTDGFAVVGKIDEVGTEKYGFVDENGTLVIPAVYDKVLHFSEGLALVINNSEDGEKDAAFIDETGQEILPLTYNGVRSFDKGCARVIRLGEGGRKRYGFIDRNGEELLPVEYIEADLFPESTLGYVADVAGRCGLFSLVPDEPPAAPEPEPAAAEPPSAQEPEPASADSPADTTDTTDEEAPKMAYASTQTVEVDGVPVEFEMYALESKSGKPVNYVKVRDIAQVLNGTPAQFNVGYADGGVNLEPGKPYVSVGSEMHTPFSGDRAYTVPTVPTKVDGEETTLKAIVLTGNKGGGYTYYKLRHLGKALNFNVGWTSERGVFIETDQPYSKNN